MVNLKKRKVSFLSPLFFDGLQVDRYTFFKKAIKSFEQYEELVIQSSRDFNLKTIIS